MFLVGMLGWWYGDGWQARIGRTGQHISGVVAFFSIGQLLATLFSPFRQISAGQVQGPMAAQLRGLVDQFISRIIGAIIRTIVIVAGIVTMIVFALFQVILLVVWFQAMLIILYAKWKMFLIGVITRNMVQWWQLRYQMK